MEGPRLLSPSCAAALSSVVESSHTFDGGSACYPDSLGSNFCSAIGECVGGAAECAETICPACTSVDGFLLGSNGAQFFGGLCPAINASSPCADLACLVDAGTQVLSPSCAAAVAALVASFEDGGLDGG